MSDITSRFSSLFKKIFNKETVSYIFFGVLTTIINLAVFKGLTLVGVDYKWSNLIAIVATKIAAYVTNKLFVFRTKTNSFLELLKEMLLFILARGLSGVFDFVALIFAVDILNLNVIYSKIAIQFIVIGMNYFFGKFVVFKSKK